MAHFVGVNKDIKISHFKKHTLIFKTINLQNYVAPYLVDLKSPPADLLTYAALRHRPPKANPMHLTDFDTPLQSLPTACSRCPVRAKLLQK